MRFQVLIDWVISQIKMCQSRYLIGFGGTKENTEKQAGAELCQAQEKLGLAMPALPSKKLGSSSI